MHRFSLKWKILGGVAAALLAAVIVAHTYCTAWLLDYVNNILANINGYAGSAESIDIDLYRSAYRINHLVVNKKEAGIPTPFIAIDKIDFSLQWKSLLHGRIVGDVTLTRPVINFAVKNAAAQDGGGVDWTKPIKDLMPIDINHARFEDGSITYQDFASTPHVNVYIRHLDGELDNLRNITSPEQPLPSTLAIEGASIGDGTLRLRGRMNILKPMPDMDMLLRLENVNLPALNNYSEAYAAFDFKSGNFDLYSRFSVKDNAVSGYVKPIASHIRVDMLESANPLQVVWTSTVAAILKVFTNPTHDQFATRVDLEGNLKNVGADPWSALDGIVRNAFIAAMSKGFDESGNEKLIAPLAPAEE